MRHEKLDLVLDKVDRVTREAMIKGFLRELGLTPPESIGNLAEGKPEIVGISDIYWNDPFFADIEFLVLWALGGQPKPFVVRSNKGGTGAVFVPLIEGKIALVSQFRSPLGKETWEVPRGFPAGWETGKKFGAAAIPKGLATALGELSEEVGKADDVVPTLLGEIAENSGTATMSPSFWLLRIGKLKLGGSEGLKIKLVDPLDAKKMVGTEINDCHSITALFLALRAMDE